MLGFDGLILSDCMVMDAIRRHYGTAHGVVEAMRAGVDMVFVSSYADLQREEGAAAASPPPKRLDRRAGAGRVCERILRAKERWIHPAEPESAGLPRTRRRRAHGARGSHCGARQGVPGKRKDFSRLRRLPHDAGLKRRPGGESVPRVYGRAFQAKFAVCSKGPDEGDRGSRQMRGRSGKISSFLLQRAPLPRPTRSRGGARRKRCR